jgi:hypothetical protein
MFYILITAKGLAHTISAVYDGLRGNGGLGEGI